jgi:hypothetical protein
MSVDWKPMSRPASIASVAGALAFMGWVAARNNQFMFLDYINLAFHEFGHLFFCCAGSVLGILGGTIAQVVIPAGLAFVFAMRGDIPGTGFCVLWTGQSLINVSVYVADARRMALPLVGGGEHDWHLLLGRFGLLECDATIAVGFKVLGWFVMIAALAWLAFAANRSWQEREKNQGAEA